MRPEQISGWPVACGEITPVILCGGSGTRLWPLSRADRPKQFVPLVGSQSLFQQTIARLSGAAYAPPLIVTADAFRFLVAEQAMLAGHDPGTILVEPAPRSTAAAALAAALWLAQRNPDAAMLIAPSDHVLTDEAGFAAAVARALPVARAGRIVTFGAVPERAETGYGWLAPSEGQGIVPLLGFVEKPDAARAQAMFAGGQHLWNMGMFLCTARVLIAAFADLAPAFMGPVAAALAAGRSDLGLFRLAPGPWDGLPSSPIDTAIMEKAANLSVVRYGGGWSDMGDWQAIDRAQHGCARGQDAQDHVTAIDCADTLLRSESDGVELVGIGLRGIIAIATGDAVLVADRSRAQDVRIAVDRLRAKGAAQADQAARTLRPWGWYEVLTEGPGFKVKRIAVKPGARLSLQSHRQRSEHWVVVSGTVRVTLGDRVRVLKPRQTADVPVGLWHRLENTGRHEAILIEVQTGSYLGEDDIQRHQDDYARVEVAADPA